MMVPRPDGLGRAKRYPPRSRVNGLAAATERDGSQAVTFTLKKANSLLMHRRSQLLY